MQEGEVFIVNYLKIKYEGSVFISVISPKEDSNGDIVFISGCAVYKYLKKSGETIKIAGSHNSGDKDGPNNETLFCSPYYLIFDSKDRIIISDAYNNEIKRIDCKKEIQLQ